MSERDGAVIALRGTAPAAAPLDDRDNDELMALSAVDRRDAFEVLVRRHLPRLTSYCAKFVGSSRSGEEIAQEVLLETWLQRRRYRSSGRFRVFLFTLARNRCLNRVRDERRRHRWDAGAPAEGHHEERAPSTPAQLDVLIEEERRRQVREAVLDLPEKLREALLLRFDQGLEYSEIARIVRRPEGTARSRVFLALKALRQALAGDSEP